MEENAALLSKYSSPARVFANALFPAPDIPTIIIRVDTLFEDGPVKKSYDM